MVKLRYFSGLSIEETAEVLGISPGTVKREWAIASGHLHQIVQPPAAKRLSGFSDRHQ